MAILELVVSQKVFDRIDGGEQYHAYIDITPYTKQKFDKQIYKNEHTYSEVRLYRSSSSKTIMRKIVRIRKGIGLPEWGAPENLVYIIEIEPPR